MLDRTGRSAPPVSATVAHREWLTAAARQTEQEFALSLCAPSGRSAHGLRRRRKSGRRSAPDHRGLQIRQEFTGDVTGVGGGRVADGSAFCLLGLGVGLLVYFR